MVILGVADGIDAGASLIIDDEPVAAEVQERHDRARRSRAFPWSAIDEVLDEAGLRARHVDEIAVAGRFSPPFFLRRHPGLRRVARDPWSWAVDAQVFFQALLRQSGLGAMEADRAGEWLEARFREHGFAPQRVTLVDIHRALAEAAYRTQPHDDVLVVTLHPMGDGTACAVHRGSDGQLDRVWAQPGFPALHTHLQRCAAAIGLAPWQDDALMWALAGTAVPDPHLVELLAADLAAANGRLVDRGLPLPERHTRPVWRALAEADRAVAAASVLDNVITAVTSLVRHHLERGGVGRLCVGGEIFDNPRLLAAVAAIDGVESLWAFPVPGYASLPTGAAAALGGLAPHPLSSVGHGRQYHERQIARALSVAGLDGARPADEADAIAAFLAEGDAVARFVGRSGFGRHGDGRRSLLVRADDPAAVERARTGLGRPDVEEPVCLWSPSPGDGTVRHLDRLRDLTRFGSAAVAVDDHFAARYPGVVTKDGRVRLQRVDPDGDPALHRLLVAVHRRTGAAALAAFPLAEAHDPVVAVPGDAIRVWRRSGARALLLGPFLVQRA